MTKQELEKLARESGELNRRYAEAVKQYREEHAQPVWKSLIGSYFKEESSGDVFRVVGVHEMGLKLLCIHPNEVFAEINEWSWHEDGTRHGFTEISRAEYLAIAGPLFAELAKMAGIAMKCCDNQAKQEGP